MRWLVWCLLFLPVPIIAGDLLLSEIFFDGTDEWIEINNTSDSYFSGLVTVSGASRSPLSVLLQIDPGGVIVLGDQGDMFTGLSGRFLLNQGLQLTDTKAISIEILLSGGVLVDTVTISQTAVQSINNQKQSFQRFLSNESRSDRTPTSKNDTIHLSSGYYGNPGETIIFSPHPTSGTTTKHNQQIIKELYAAEGTGYIFFYSGIGSEQVSEIEVNNQLIWSGGGQFTEILRHNLPISGGNLMLVDRDGQSHYYQFPAFQSGDAYQFTTSSSGKYIFSDQVIPSVSFGSGVVEGEEDETSKDDPPYFTGSYCTSCDRELSDSTGTSSETAALIISEIFPYDSGPYAEYIELTAQADVSGKVAIAGLGHGGATKEVSVTIRSGNRLIVTDTITGLLTTLPVIRLPSISLTDSGEELQISRQSGQVIDTAVYVGQEKGKAYYFSAFSGEDRLFNQQGDPSPGSSREYQQLLCVDKESPIPMCAIAIQNSRPFYSHHKINLQAVFNQKSLSNSTDYTCIWSFGEQTDYLFTGCNPSYYEYMSSGLYQVGLTIQAGADILCQTTTIINYPQKGGDSATSRDGYYQGLYKKWKGRFGTLRDQIKKLGYTPTYSGYITGPTTKEDRPTVDRHPKEGVILISHVLPNPVGIDRDHEGITLENLTTGQVHFSGLLVGNGTTERKLPAITIPASSSIQLTGTFGLTNKKTCLHLFDSQYLYDLLCYQTPQEGARLTGTHVSAAYSAEADRMSAVDLKERDNHLCLVYKRKDIFCSSVHELSVVKKYQKNIEKIQHEAAKREKKYTKETKKRAHQEKKYANRIDAVYADKDYRQQRSRLAEGYQYLVDELLLTHWQVVYGSPKLRKLRELAHRLRDNLSARRDYILGSIRYHPDQIEEIYQLEEESLPLTSVELRVVSRGLVVGAQPYIDRLRQTSSIFSSLPIR